MKRALLILIIIFSLCNPLFAISFNKDVYSISTLTDFGLSLAPVKATYGFQVQGLQLSKNDYTSLEFNFTSGYGERLFEFPGGQKPNGVVYGHTEAFFTQGFLRSPLCDSDLFRLFVSYEANFEQAIASTGDALNNQPLLPDGIVPHSYNVNMIGNKKMMDNVFKAGITIPWSWGPPVEHNGIYGSFYVAVSPHRLNEYTMKHVGLDVPVDYTKYNLSLNFYYTPFALRMKNNLSIFSIRLYDSFYYRYIDGLAIPEYQVGARWTKEYNNFLGIIIFGPEIFSSEGYIEFNTRVHTYFYHGDSLNGLYRPHDYDYGARLQFNAHIQLLNVFHLGWNASYAICRNIPGTNKLEIVCDKFEYDKSVSFWISI